MTTSFKILFMAEVMHDFYKDGKCSDFRFIPTEETSRLLVNYKAICKTIGNKLIVLMKTDDAGKPFIKPKSTDKFTFYMELMKPLFMTVSNLELNALAGKRFYFTNLHQNKVTVAVNTDVLYLSKQIEAYAPAANYLPGNFVKETNVVYECIHASLGNVPPNAAFWISRQKNQYASASDLIQFIPVQNTFPVSPAAASITVSVFKLNLTNNLFDELALQQIFNFETVVTDVLVDLSSLAEAKYKVVINAQEFFVYVSNDAVYKNMFAVADLYNHLPDGNDFAFLDGTGKIKDQFIAGKNVWLNYRIGFANRVAFWKYLIPKKGVQAIDSNPDYTFSGNANPADIFTSQQPIPLVEKPHEFKVTLFQPVSSEPPLAPNPDVNASGMLTKNGSDYYCNIYLNY
jgi:hypothetical protein